MVKMSAQRVLISCGFALAALAAPAAAMISAAPATSVPAAACPAGEESDVFSGDCQPFLAPNTNSPDYSGNFSEPLSQVDGANPDVPVIDGVPCTGENSGECIGLAEDQVPNDVSPHSTVSSSP
jgi:hypothetical protein